MKEESEGPRPVEILGTPSSTSDASSGDSSGGIQTGSLLDDDIPVIPERESELPTRPRPSLDAPAPEVLPLVGNDTVS